MTAPLNILHVTVHPSRRGGGVARYLWTVADRLERLGNRSTVAGIAHRQRDDHCHDRGRIELLTAPPIGPESLGYAPALSAALKTAIQRAHVVHLHGLRTMLNWQARRWAQQYDKPLVIAPHGQLDPWLLKQRRGRKWVTDRMWVNKNLRCAALLHAVSPREAQQIRAAAPKARIMLAMPGIEPHRYAVPPDRARAMVDQRWPALRGRRLLLFLGAIMPRKGPQVLAEAWRRMRDRYGDWHVALGGMDVSGYRQVVERAFGNAAADGCASFLGEVPESLKPHLLAAADLFVLPSYSEAFGIAVAEALAAGCPVITTRATPWGDLVDRQCGWWIETGVQPLTKALGQAMALTDQQRQAMGQRGRAYISRWCSWENTADHLQAAYRWIAAQGPRPANVYDPEQPLPDSFADAHD